MAENDMKTISSGESDHAATLDYYSDLIERNLNREHLKTRLLAAIKLADNDNKLPKLKFGRDITGSEVENINYNYGVDPYPPSVRERLALYKGDGEWYTGKLGWRKLCERFGIDANACEKVWSQSSVSIEREIERAIGNWMTPFSTTADPKDEIALSEPIRLPENLTETPEPDKLDELGAQIYDTYMLWRNLIDEQKEKSDEELLEMAADLGYDPPTGTDYNRFISLCKEEGIDYQECMDEWKEHGKGKVDAGEPFTGLVGELLDMPAEEKRKLHIDRTKTWLDQFESFIESQWRSSWEEVFRACEATGGNPYTVGGNVLSVWANTIRALLNKTETHNFPIATMDRHVESALRDPLHTAKMWTLLLYDDSETSRNYSMSMEALRLRRQKAEQTLNLIVDNLVFDNLSNAETKRIFGFSREEIKEISKRVPYWQLQEIDEDIPDEEKFLPIIQDISEKSTWRNLLKGDSEVRTILRHGYIDDESVPLRKRVIEGERTEAIELMKLISQIYNILNDMTYACVAQDYREVTAEGERAKYVTFGCSMKDLQRPIRRMNQLLEDEVRPKIQSLKDRFQNILDETGHWSKSAGAFSDRYGISFYIQRRKDDKKESYSIIDFLERLENQMDAIVRAEDSDGIGRPGIIPLTFDLNCDCKPHARTSAFIPNIIRRDVKRTRNIRPMRRMIKEALHEGKTEQFGGPEKIPEWLHWWEKAEDDLMDRLDEPILVYDIDWIKWALHESFGIDYTLHNVDEYRDYKRRLTNEYLLSYTINIYDVIRNLKERATRRFDEDELKLPEPMYDKDGNLMYHEIKDTDGRVHEGTLKMKNLQPTEFFRGKHPRPFSIKEEREMIDKMVAEGPIERFPEEFIEFSFNLHPSTKEAILRDSRKLFNRAIAKASERASSSGIARTYAEGQLMRELKDSRTEGLPETTPVSDSNDRAVGAMRDIYDAQMITGDIESIKSVGNLAMACIKASFTERITRWFFKESRYLQNQYALNRGLFENTFADLPTNYHGTIKYYRRELEKKIEELAGPETKEEKDLYDKALNAYHTLGNFEDIFNDLGDDISKLSRALYNCDSKDYIKHSYTIRQYCPFVFKKRKEALRTIKEDLGIKMRGALKLKDTDPILTMRRSETMADMLEEIMKEEEEGVFDTTRLMRRVYVGTPERDDAELGDRPPVSAEPLAPYLAIQDIEAELQIGARDIDPDDLCTRTDGILQIADTLFDLTCNCRVGDTDIDKIKGRLSAIREEIEASEYATPEEKKRIKAADILDTI